MKPPRPQPAVNMSTVLHIFQVFLVLGVPGALSAPEPPFTPGKPVSREPRNDPNLMKKIGRLPLPIDSSIRIHAYDPKPVYPPKPIFNPNAMLARRMGIDPGVIQDVLRPTRQAQEPRARRPLKDNRNRRKPLSPRRRISPVVNRRTTNKESETLPEQELNPALIVLTPDQLRNPSRVNSPIGPPVISSTTRSVFGEVHPPSIHPPSAGVFVGDKPSPVSPPAPPVFTPAPPTAEGGPPSVPPPAMSPSPPPGLRESQVTDIRCLEFGGQETFEAILTLPDDYEAVPVFEDRPMIDPTTNPSCRMIPTQLVGMFQLIVSNYEGCGVRKCRQSNDETWHCIVLRFPRINGLKLPEDEMIEIRCRPHDRTADDIHVLSVATAKYADKSGIMTNKPPTVFEGLQEFECEIGLFRQLAGTQQFNTRVKDDAPLELGEKVQLWSIIKGGDGWEYSRLSEIVIQKEDGSQERSTQNTIVLVFSDGCRNPNYKLIAEDHPFRDPSNKLVNKFTFRAFMFQDMEPGDSLLISAKVLGCVLEADCTPATCPDDGEVGYGKRRKRRETGNVKEFEFTTRMTVPETTGTSFTTATPTESLFKSHVRRVNNVTTDWSRNLAIKIRMPNETIKQKSVKFRDCKLYLFISLGISLFFCVLAIGFVSFSLLRMRVKKVDSRVTAPSTESKRPKKKPLQINISSSGSETIYNSSNPSSSSGSDLRKLPVPPTVKQRKREVNAELMGLFGTESMVPYNGTYPPLLNYYGYMVVPRPQPNCEKKSVRAMKRNARARSIPHFCNPENKVIRNGTNKSSTHCSCKERHEDNPQSDNESSNSTHTSVIQITSSGSETISKVSSNRKPKAKPRLSRTDNNNDQHIYNEIQEVTLPTLV